MDPLALPLYYCCAISGALIIAGSLFLLYTQRIYIDAQTKEITAIELPIGVKLRTNAPVLALFLMGGGLLLYPIVNARDFVKAVHIQGELPMGSRRVTIYAVTSLDAPANGNREFSLAVPALAEGTQGCRVLYTDNLIGLILDEKKLHFDKAQDGVLTLSPPKYEPSPSSNLTTYRGTIAPAPPEFERR